MRAFCLVVSLCFDCTQLARRLVADVERCDESFRVDELLYDRHIEEVGNRRMVATAVAQSKNAARIAAFGVFQNKHAARFIRARRAERLAARSRLLYNRRRRSATLVLVC